MATFITLTSLQAESLRLPSPLVTVPRERNVHFVQRTFDNYAAQRTFVRGAILDGGAGIAYANLQVAYEYLTVLKTREILRSTNKP